MENQKNESFRIKKGILQGCILSPMLFNIYLEKIFNITFENEEIGIKVKGIRVNNIRYADNAIITESMQDMQKIINKLERIGREFGVRISVANTKEMVIKKEEGRLEN